MEQDAFLSRIQKHYNDQLPFVIFSHPLSQRVQGYFQKDATLYSSEDFSEDSIILAPFDYKGQHYFISKKNSVTSEGHFSTDIERLSKLNITEAEEDVLRHKNLIEKALEEIKADEASKIVLSRVKEVSLTEFQLPTLIKRLMGLYPRAFRYCWYHPNTGLWCGATPEVLFSIYGQNFSTMALAGTKLADASGEMVWGQKELDEQKIVTDDIVAKLSPLADKLEISKVTEHKAGSVMHLRTDISGQLSINNMNTLANALHPTPAICGKPQRYAKNFILKNEGYERELYTGFIGEVGSENEQTNIYVNLRCMKVSESCAYIYVGGGITGDSNASDEWIETQNKMQTMLQVLNPLL